MLYRVLWEIEVDADSPGAAALLALKIQRDPNSLATYFDVEPDGSSQTLHIENGEAYVV